MNRVALKVLFGLSLLFAAVYLLLDSNFLTLLEGANLDGSSSITWRSVLALLLLTALTQGISFWTFRRHIALRVFVGLGMCIMASIYLFYSSFAFRWEPHNADGTWPITWRSDLVILALISVTQGISFLIFGLARRKRPNDARPETAPHPNI
jgi:hypothetical protein